MAAGVYPDGDFSVAQACGYQRVTYDPKSLAYIFRQQFMQYAANWVAVPLNTLLPGTTDTVLVEETEQQDLGGGVVQWERVYAQIPPERADTSTCVKTIKYLRTTFSGTTIVNAAVATQSATVRCDVRYYYSLNAGLLNIPAYPDVSVETIGPFTSIVATGGFVYTYQGGDNSGYHFISGDISFYKGRIYQMRLVFA
jgi:hypothetical protein